MTAVLSSQLGTIQQPSNHENLSDYVHPHLRQPLPQPSTHSASSTALHQGVIAHENGRRRRPNERSVTLADPRQLAKPRPDLAQLDRPVQTPTELPVRQDSHGARPKGQLLRASTDIGSQRESLTPKSDITEENWELRHGWEDQYNSSEYLGLLSSVSIWAGCVIGGCLSMMEADLGVGRLSTCITPTSAMIRAASRRMKIIVIRLKNGE